jgi:C4-type Zn-finger protein
MPMTTRTLDCPICGEDGLIVYRAVETMRLVCSECGWRTTKPLVAGVDLDEAIAAAVQAAQKPVSAPIAPNDIT